MLGFHPLITGAEDGAERGSRGLLSKRAELAQKLQQLDDERRSITDDIAALDRAALVFDLTHAAHNGTGRVSRKRPAMAVSFQRRELMTLIGQVLRSADGHVATADIAAAIADRKKVPADDRATRAWLTNRISITLSGLERSKAATGMRTPGERAVRWMLAR
jgi:hypothetical protein